jgi:hypothetical protein
VKAGPEVFKISHGQQIGTVVNTEAQLLVPYYTDVVNAIKE